MPAVAVAVISWNTRELLIRCLRSLAAEAESGRAEVWVVDNASADGSAAAAQAVDPSAITYGNNILKVSEPEPPKRPRRGRGK